MRKLDDVTKWEKKYILIESLTGRTRADKIGVGAGGDIGGTDISCIFMTRQYTGPTRQSYRDDHRHVGDPLDKYAGTVRTRLSCDVRCVVASVEKIGVCCFVRLGNRSLKLLDKMCSKYDTVTLIELVESRPCLWDKTSEEFKDREMKSKLWIEVCSFLEPNFLQLDRKEPNESR